MKINSSDGYQKKKKIFLHYFINSFDSMGFIDKDGYTSYNYIHTPILFLVVKL